MPTSTIRNHSNASCTLTTRHSRDNSMPSPSSVFWVDELIDAISKYDTTKIAAICQRHKRWIHKSLPAYKGQSLCDAIKNRNKNILHYIFRYCPQPNIWSCVRLVGEEYCNSALSLVGKEKGEQEEQRGEGGGGGGGIFDGEEGDENFFSLMFQEDENGWTPIHLALVFGQFQDVWLIVHSVLMTHALHYGNNHNNHNNHNSQSNNSNGNSNVNNNNSDSQSMRSLFDHGAYVQLLRPFSELVMKDELITDQATFSAMVQREINRKLIQSCDSSMYLPLTRLLVEHLGSSAEFTHVDVYSDDERDTVHHGRNCLLTAVIHRQAPTIDYLVTQCKANVNLLDRSNGYSVLTYSVTLNGDSLHWFEYFVSHGANFRADGGLWLEKAAQLLRLDVIQFFCSQNNTSNGQTIMKTNLLSAVFSNSETDDEQHRHLQHGIIEEIVKLLSMKEGPHEARKKLEMVNYGSGEDSVVVQCAKRGMVKTVELLLENGVDLKLCHDTILNACPSQQMREELKRKMIQMTPREAWLPL